MWLGNASIKENIKILLYGIFNKLSQQQIVFKKN